MTPSPKLRALARGLNEFPGQLARVLAVISSAVTILAALLLTAEVLSRAFLDQPIRGLFEIIQPMVVLIAFLGLAEAERNGDHIRVTLLTDRLPRRGRMGVRIFALAASGLIVLWMLVMSWFELLKSLNRGEFAAGLLDVPIWPARIIIVVGLGALVLMYLQRTIEAVVAFVRDFRSPGVEITTNPADTTHQGGQL